MSDEPERPTGSASGGLVSSSAGPRKRALLAVVAIVGAGAAAVAGYVVLRGHTDGPDPSAKLPCVSCHTKTSHWSASWEKSKHKSLECKACHTGDPDGAQLAAAAHRPKSGSFPRHGVVAEQVCATCHPPGARDADAGTEKATGHSVHARGNIPCMRCHSKAIHVDRPWKAVCGDCHRAVSDSLHQVANRDMTCVACHNFLARATAIDHGRGRCLGCHQKSARLDFASGVHNQPECVRCHYPHTPRAEDERRVSRAECARCHEKPVSETAKIPKKAPGQPATPAQSEDGATVGDTHGVCRTCHAPHSSAGGAAAKCHTCHRPGINQHLTQRHAGCVTCHAPHDWTALSKAKNACARCHSQVASANAQASAGHSQCVACHAPHSAVPPKGQCGRCHAQLASAVEGESRSHRDCTNCHKPHQRKGQAAKACGNCHSKLTLRHPRTQADCLSCHKAHALKAHKPATGCARCHAKQGQAVAATTGLHRCETCHRPHGDLPRGIRSCAECHRRHARDADMKHRACVACHQVHGLGKHKAVEECAKCHRGQAKVTAAKGGPHAQCANCHEPHSGRGLRAVGTSTCGRCHSKVATTVKAVTRPAPHADCRSCHKPHDWRPSATLCAGCHRKPASLAAAFVDSRPGARAVHGKCASCHAAHGSPKPQKACESCHRRRGGLHASSGHTRCAACHEPHRPDVSGRAKCLACHTKMRDHRPAASECKGCHMFRS